MNRDEIRGNPPCRREAMERAWEFAVRAHDDQRMPDGRTSYLAHVGAVVMEVMGAVLEGDVAEPELALVCAILHDVVEDTGVVVEEIGAAFGTPVARGVAALTKNPALPKKDRMRDSIARLLLEPPSVQLVKLADRIVNLAPPPSCWSGEKIAGYRQEAREILEALGNASPVLSRRLEARIGGYPPKDLHGPIFPSGISARARGVQ